MIDLWMYMVLAACLGIGICGTGGRAPWESLSSRVKDSFAKGFQYSNHAPAHGSSASCCGYSKSSRPAVIVKQIGLGSESLKVRTSGIGSKSLIVISRKNGSTSLKMKTGLDRLKEPQSKTSFGLDWLKEPASKSSFWTSELTEAFRNKNEEEPSCWESKSGRMSTTKVGSDAENLQSKMVEQFLESIKRLHRYIEDIKWDIFDVKNEKVLRMACQETEDEKENLRIMLNGIRDTVQYGEFDRYLSKFEDVCWEVEEFENSARMRMNQLLRDKAQSLSASRRLETDREPTSSRKYRRFLSSDTRARLEQMRKLAKLRFLVEFEKREEEQREKERLEKEKRQAEEKNIQERQRLKRLKRVFLRRAKQIKLERERKIIETKSILKAYSEEDYVVPFDGVRNRDVATDNLNLNFDPVFVKRGPLSSAPFAKSLVNGETDFFSCGGKIEGGSLPASPLAKSDSGGDTIPIDTVLEKFGNCNLENGLEEIGTSHVVRVFVGAKSNPEKFIECYCVLDIQSNASFVSQEVANILELNGTDTNLTLHTMSKTGEIVGSKKFCDLEVLSYDWKNRVSIPCAYLKNEVPDCKSQVARAKFCKQWDHLLEVTDKLAPFDSDLPVGILIGCDVPKASRPLEIVFGGDNEPYAQRTTLGWSVVGPLCKSPEETCGNRDVVINRVDLAMENVIENHVEFDADKAMGNCVVLVSGNEVKNCAELIVDHAVLDRAALADDGSRVERTRVIDKAFGVTKGNWTSPNMLYTTLESSGRDESVDRKIMNEIVVRGEMFPPRENSQFVVNKHVELWSSKDEHFGNVFAKSMTDLNRELAGRVPDDDLEWIRRSWSITFHIWPW